MNNFLLKETVTKAEIKWCLQAVYTHKSLRCAERDVQSFPDSEIAKRMQLGRDKMAYMIVYGIAPFLKQNLLDEILVSEHFVVGFDESINKVSQKQQMDINIRVWDRCENRVKTWYLTSAFLGRTRAPDLLEAFTEATKPLDLKTGSAFNGWTKHEQKAFQRSTSTN
ncbi:hypothetical protein AVEN_2551-1 [Araneus ventricosus]|uniref:Uncharacterized protein n=1 Tax=Araneus ventricosus TaxID=182803 RepID=A0A4Y2TK28_ARAVE|nr:hypothetical protein AVEN_2551-1 [Araneus ventricosus]